ncbi:hypothetical protein R6Q59_004044 [Mikania micrantha]
MDVFMKLYSIATTLFLLIGIVPLALAGVHDYQQALTKSILFFEAQRSAWTAWPIRPALLPGNQRVKWRGNSGLMDGKLNGVDLVGGYYDAGDNVKFGLPMAFTVTMMSWSIIEYGKQLAKSGELGHAMDAVKWGTDYLIKAHPHPYVLYGEVGDGNTDHYCWQRPEDMTTSRNAYIIDQNNPGSGPAGETAAAMAASSIVFRRYNPSYSKVLLTHAYQLFDFADKYRGKYDSSITVAHKYYRSVSGYADELLWAAAWLYKATSNRHYLNYLGTNGDTFGGTGWSMTEFGWEFLMSGKAGRHGPVFGKYQQKAENFMCACLGKSGRNVQKTPGGLIFRRRWNNLQFVTSASFLLTVYSDYLTSARRNLRCSSGTVDYILGDNPRATSYMVEYGKNYPRHVHHRGSSIVSIKVNPSFVSCRGGYATWYSRKASDPNLLTGAVVGGPDAYDNKLRTKEAIFSRLSLLHITTHLFLEYWLDSMLAMLVITSSFQPKVTPSSGLIAITQKTASTWVANDKKYHRYSVMLTSNTNKTFKKVDISVSKFYGGLTKTKRSSYRFPTWVGSLPARKNIEFEYFHTASPAKLAVSSYILT